MGTARRTEWTRAICGGMSFKRLQIDRTLQIKFGKSWAVGHRTSMADKLISTTSRSASTISTRFPASLHYVRRNMDRHLTNCGFRHGDGNHISAPTQVSGRCKADGGSSYLTPLFTEVNCKRCRTSATSFHPGPGHPAAARCTAAAACSPNDTRPELRHRARLPLRTAFRCDPIAGPMQGGREIVVSDPPCLFAREKSSGDLFKARNPSTRFLRARPRRLAWGLRSGPQASHTHVAQGGCGYDEL
jgi:hypothetical protein